MMRFNKRARVRDPRCLWNDAGPVDLEYIASRPANSIPLLSLPVMIHRAFAREIFSLLALRAGIFSHT
jgi:hypothetical protein